MHIPIEMIENQLKNIGKYKAIKMNVFILTSKMYNTHLFKVTLHMLIYLVYNSIHLMYIFTCIGTECHVLENRPKDFSTNGLRRWTFSILAFWGESPKGNFVIDIFDTV